MKDARGRSIRYLRLSLTDRCNFRCVYCRPRADCGKLPRGRVLRLEELLEVVRVMAERLGIAKVRVTGGEPLVRRGVVDFLEDLCRIPSVREVSLTTNGALLESLAIPLRRAGIRGVNVSLDSLRRDRFAAITGRDRLDAVLRGIQAVRRAGFHPVKINVVVMRRNLDEVLDFVAFGMRQEIEVRFIELMPFAGDWENQHVPAREIRRRISRRHKLTPLPSEDVVPGPARRYSVDEGRATLGFISPVSAPFCSRCNRIRLRCDGTLIPCLKSPVGFDLMPFVRPRLEPEALAERVRSLVSRQVRLHPNRCP